MDGLKAPLFINWRERFILLLILALLFLAGLGYRYYLYLNYYAKSKIFTTVTVLDQYKKGEKTLLKLKSEDGFVFYSASKEELKDLRGRKAKAVIYGKPPGFIESLSTHFRGSNIYYILPKNDSFKEKIKKTIASQHGEGFSKELYKAIFLGIPLSKEYKELLSYLGLSHLVAISGFHLGVLATALYIPFALFYSPLQKRFFPYRNGTRDYTVFVLLVLFGYLLLLGEIPSLVRAFALSVAAFFLMERNIEILSFETLFWVVAILLSVFPEYLFSVGFWFSVAGVFYIYLFLHHFSHLSKPILAILLNLWVFIAMIPPVHYFFGNFSYLQFLSPAITMIFALFYPLGALLHLLGLGFLLDPILESAIEYEFERYFFKTGEVFLVIYLLLSLLSIYYKRVFWLLLASALGFLIYNVAQF